jgi:hypothetical protein
VEDWARTLDDRDTAFQAGGFTMTLADEDRGMAASSDWNSGRREERE